MALLFPGPGYDDTRIRPWNGANTHARDGGAYYEAMWREALALRPHAVSITSYNEWGEGTQIEPARPHTTADGTAYLDYGAEHGLYLRLTSRWAARAAALRAHPPAGSGRESWREEL